MFTEDLLWRAAKVASLLNRLATADAAVATASLKCLLNKCEGLNGSIRDCCIGNGFYQSIKFKQY